MKQLSQIVLLLGAVLLLTQHAMAHKVNVFAYVDGATVYTESYFPDGRPVKAGKIQVYDSEDVLLLEGVTDSNGLFNFAVPKIDDLRIVLEAGMGHRAEIRLKKDEVGAGG